ncbi:hypothetical protein QFC19_004413 [Naganishia cerealis]|uniref:Uncharacterized protein n=1 Tax=Naganishia cerealis TaxID=610337 RepID=A0ACC2VVU8_9TREE|nr:hypothetical protein QFC19_004413 [Naganishia cerealis]
MTKSNFEPKIKISIDRGGTFCDVIGQLDGHEDYVFKLLSVDPANYLDAPTEGIRRVLSKFENHEIPQGQKLKLDNIQSVRMGTTVATNALLERKGAKVCLVTSKGFKDVLAIGNQTRPDIFDLSAHKFDQLYSEVLEIDERVTPAGFSEGGGSKLVVEEDENVRRGASGELIKVLQEPDYEQIENQLEALHERKTVDCFAICFVHAFVYPIHEQKVADICRKLGFSVSVSHELQPMIGMVNRASSTVADAYLSPILHEYIKSISHGFEGGLDSLGNKLLFMQSNGGLCPWYKFTGLKAILSGPAGGLVGYGLTCYDSEERKATIGFDAGGTSTDVSRFDENFEHIYETVVNQVSLQTPQLDISTVAAGGGSMLFWRNGMFVSGPESAGSDPGPACYRKGGPLTVTDANLFLGRLIPGYFPKIFGPGQNELLSLEATANLMHQLTKKINIERPNDSPLSAEEVAAGFLKVAVESMSRPIRSLTEAKGFNPSDHNLACFGGSGGQFAVALARNLGIKHIALHKYSSLLSAYGISLADIMIEKQHPVSFEYNSGSHENINRIISSAVQAAFEDYTEQGLTEFDTTLEVYLNMHYQGADSKLLIPKGEKHNCDVLFIERHNREFGFTLDRAVLVQDIQVLLKVHTGKRSVHNPFAEYRQLKLSGSLNVVDAHSRQMTYFEAHGWLDIGVYHLNDLSCGNLVRGPAIILDDTQTVLLDPQSEGVILREHILLSVENIRNTNISKTTVNPVQLSVFGHRFISIAEQMGKTLEQTAISTNIKERLDFSCAIFDKNGDLIANAPHIPIHLGAMSFAVKAQIRLWDGNIKPGDVFVSNHPKAGGTHLPDITVITPIFVDNSAIPLFWAASRGHHADIGSISPGSMPSNSKVIYEEGAAIITHKLYSEGQFDDVGMTRLLLEEPAKYPGSSGTRCLSDNLSDLKAQVSANYKGLTLLKKLTDEYSYEVVALYMSGIQEVAETAVKNLLRSTERKFVGRKLSATDYLDDGTPICLDISIDSKEGTAIFDFRGTGDEIYGNLNAPKSILHSAVLYVLRTLINMEIPLNNGCLKPISILTREGSVIDPSFEAAVVGGNVETSQRIVDVILRAFKVAGASQGTLNNLTFGIDDKEKSISFGYYESIAGGAGAGHTWDGQSGVQCHITNTRMTDVEVFEKRYPVVVHDFRIRTNSGGQGRHCGGDGVVREIEFTYPNLSVTCLLERRTFEPYGMAGGENGQKGRNVWIKNSYNEETGTFSTRNVYLGGKNTITVGKGDRVKILTPGGGGFGSKDGDIEEDFFELQLNKGESQLGATGSLGSRRRMQESN